MQPLVTYSWWLLWFLLVSSCLFYMVGLVGYWHSYLNICQNDWRPWMTSSSILYASSSGWGPSKQGTLIHWQGPKFPGEQVCVKSSLCLPPTAWKIFQVPLLMGMEDLPGTPFWWACLLTRCYLKFCSASFGIRTHPRMEITLLCHHVMFYVMLGFEPGTSCALSNHSIKWATSSFQLCGSLQAGPFAPRGLNTHHFKSSKGTHIPHPLLQVMSNWELFLVFSTQKPHHSLLDAVWRSSSSEAITVSTGHQGMRVLAVKK